MDRKRIIVAACMILAAVFIIALTWKTGPANTGSIPSGNQAQVVTQGGTVTFVPGEKFASFTVVANLPTTNTQSKTSSPSALPKSK
jgi:hypothetical protein